MDQHQRRNSGFEAAAGNPMLVVPMHGDALNRSYMMDDGQSQMQPASPTNLMPNGQFPEFTFPYAQPGDSLAQAHLEHQSDPFNLSGPGPLSDQHGSTAAGSHPGFAGHVQFSQPSNGSPSDEESPTSTRASRGLEMGYNDEFGVSNEAPVDGSDLGGRSMEEKSDAAPAWSELKTKAGKERKRLPLACIACRRKKIRCSGEKPACKHCLKSRIPCVYKVTTRKAAPRTDYMAMLDKRLKRMEDRIIKIVPKEEQDDTISVTRGAVKPAIPGTILSPSSSAKKRAANEAFGPELDKWSRSTVASNLENDSRPSTLCIQEAEDNKIFSEGAEALPSKEIQQHLAEVFFENIYGQTYLVLHKPSFMKKLANGTLPPVLILAVCAISARFSTHPGVSQTPAFLRGEEWASEARKIVVRRHEWPNITILTCLLLLGLHEFGTCQGGRSWSFGGMAIRMAFALQLHRDLDHEPGQRNEPTTPLSFIDREIRRRTMWACFLMDRFNSSGTERPTFIPEETMKIPLPIKERSFQLDMPGMTEDLKGGMPHLLPDSPNSTSQENMGVAAYTIRSIAIWGQIINYHNLGGKDRDRHPMWHPESEYTSIMKRTEDFATSLPNFMVYNQENLQTHATDGMASQFLFLHIAIQQNILFMHRNAVPAPGPAGSRGPADIPKDFVTTAGSRAFEAANRISELLQDGEPYLITAPFTGYCAFFSSTVQIFGAFSKNEEMEATSKRNLATNVKYLSKMKRYWGMFHFMSENLKDMYRNYADAAKQGGAGVKPPYYIFQYGDWFNKYPHGVSESDFEDPATGIKKEKGEDAVLEQKSDYHTVEDFFNTLSPKQAQEAGKGQKRKQKKPSSLRQGIDPGNSNALNTTNPAVMHNNQQVPHSYNHISPSNENSANMYQPPPPFYDQEAFLPPQQQSMLPQLDRQLVFGAYGGVDLSGPSQMPSQGILDQTGWDMQMNGMPGFMNEPSSAWMMPFNMQPPEFGQESDYFNTMGGVAVAGYRSHGGNGVGGN